LAELIRQVLSTKREDIMTRRVFEGTDDEQALI